MGIKQKVTLLFGVLVLTAVSRFALSKTKVVSGITPAIQYVEKGIEAGPAVELLKRLFEEAQLDYHFESTNWAKAHQIFAQTPQSLMFSVARFDSREDDFLWVLEVAPFDLHIARSKKRPDLNPTTIEELKQHKLAVVRGAAPHNLLLQAGFVEEKDFGTVATAEEIIKYMDTGFVEFVFYESTISPLMLKLFNFPADYLVPLDIPLPVNPKLWLVASKDFPQDKLQLLQNTHQRLLADPAYQKLRMAILPLSHGGESSNGKESSRERK